MSEKIEDSTNPHYLKLMNRICELKRDSVSVMNDILDNKDIDEKETVLLIGMYVLGLKPSSDSALMLFNKMTERELENE